MMAWIVWWLGFRSGCVCAISMKATDTREFHLFAFFWVLELCHKIEFSWTLVVEPGNKEVRDLIVVVVCEAGVEGGGAWGAVGACMALIDATNTVFSDSSLAKINMTCFSIILLYLQATITIWKMMKLSLASTFIATLALATFVYESCECIQDTIDWVDSIKRLLLKFF